LINVRFREALPHAEIADRLLTHGVSAGAQELDAQAHHVLVEMHEKLGK
jgi:hypothetical protein